MLKVIKFLTLVSISVVSIIGKNLLKRSSFLCRDVLLDLYFQVILPSVLYGLVVWGGCVNVEQLNSLEMLHRIVR